MYWDLAAMLGETALDLEIAKRLGKCEKKTKELIAHERLNIIIDMWFNIYKPKWEYLGGKIK
jgi:hypothetical protein